MESHSILYSWATENCLCTIVGVEEDPNSDLSDQRYYTGSHCRSHKAGMRCRSLTLLPPHKPQHSVLEPLQLNEEDLMVASYSAVTRDSTVV